MLSNFQIPRELDITEGQIVSYYDPDSDGGSCQHFLEEKYSVSQDVKIVAVPLGRGRPDVHRKIIHDHLYPGSIQLFWDTTPSDDELRAMVYRGHGAPQKALSFIGIYDHHETEKKRIENFRIEYFPGFEPPPMQFIVDPGMPSAAHLAWALLNPGRDFPPLLAFIDKVENGDLVTLDEELVAAYVDSYDFRNPAAIPKLKALYSMPLHEIKMLGAPILMEQYQKLEKLQNSPERFSHTPMDFGPGIRNRIVPVVNARLPDYGRPIEKLLKKMALESPDGVSCAWFRKKTDGSIKLCIRSYDENFPAENIATHFHDRGRAWGISGGGHHNKAAVQFPDENIFSQFITLRHTHKEAMQLVPALHYSI